MATEMKRTSPPLCPPLPPPKKSIKKRYTIHSLVISVKVAPIERPELFFQLSGMVIDCALKMFHFLSGQRENMGRQWWSEMVAPSPEEASFPSPQFSTVGRQKTPADDNEVRSAAAPPRNNKDYCVHLERGKNSPTNIACVNLVMGLL